MATNRLKIEKGELRKLFAHPRSRFHKWMKRQMNKYIRRQPIDDDDIGLKTNRKPTRGYEF